MSKRNPNYGYWRGGGADNPQVVKNKADIAQLQGYMPMIPYKAVEAEGGNPVTLLASGLWSSPNTSGPELVFNPYNSESTSSTIGSATEQQLLFSAKFFSGTPSLPYARSLQGWIGSFNFVFKVAGTGRAVAPTATVKIATWTGGDASINPSTITSANGQSDDTGGGDVPIVFTRNSDGDFVGVCEIRCTASTNGTTIRNVYGTARFYTSGLPAGTSLLNLYAEYQTA